ncbi:molybdopterin/thiamine biosynthesis adenylyltransferase [Rhizobium leguminosarum]|uniref:ThiF family adenylyltransferase n=1 Tax=Rhizobium leguminosarum TaxID=384 RepID=UPI001AE3B368|nr:ThiF family adenylyltransferase [Rhizobium leguminosarum]MBP2490929.1 molybdopterin/thiamine biosynthesis adenylyltransferase [Rhizobium leguminosarum]
MKSDLTLNTLHLGVLTAELCRPDGKEHAAYILFGLSRIGKDPFDGEPRLRLMVKEVLPVEETEIKSSDHQHISWSTKRFVELLARANRDGLQLGIAHSHPHGPDHFSSQDDRNEAELARLAQNRNGEDAMLPSLLFADGELAAARVWKSPNEVINIDRVRTAGSRWRTIFFGAAQDAESPALARQELALGAGFNRMMRHMRIGVVGAGGTGSPLLQQFARMGAGQIAIFDPDHVEHSNLNRLYGATWDDAERKIRKVDVARREIERMGLGTRVETYDAWIGSPECRDALKSMDVIFGCTDDHDGRLLLNRLAYYYLIPVVDVGLALRVTTRFGISCLEADGRVTVLEPGSSCLVCRRVVDAGVAAEEALRRSNPEEYERRKSEAYVRGEGSPSPAVIPFTTSVATMAVEELIQRLNQFRGEDGAIANRVRKFNLVEDFRPGAKKEPCRICGSERIHGLGDVQPFLGRAG